MTNIFFPQISAVVCSFEISQKLRFSVLHLHNIHPFNRAKPRPVPACRQTGAWSFIFSLILTESSGGVNDLQDPAKESLEVLSLWMGKVDGMV